MVVGRAETRHPLRCYDLRFRFQVSVPFSLISIIALSSRLAYQISAPILSVILSGDLAV